MAILGNKTIVGLFDNDADVEDVVTTLQERGFGQESDNEIKIVDENRLAQETPIESPQQKTTTQPAGGSGVTAPMPATTVTKEGTQTDKAVIENSARERLMELGLNKEEAEFHARHVGRGSSLVIIEANKEQVAEIQEIIEEANGRASIA